MRRWNFLFILVTLVPAVYATGSAEVEAQESDEDSEGDSAPFVVAIEHSNGWRCSGSLVSTRTVLTSAWCALGPPPALLPAPTAPSTEAPLWAMAGSRPRGPHAIRRVTSISLAYEARAEELGANLNRERWAAWGGAENDMALLELTTAFGSAANVQPILLAAAEQDCGAAVCHSVHGAGRGLLTIEVLTRASASCAPLAPHWQAVREKALCYKGPELCPNEWGSGVICGGKLCGVISRSAREDINNDSSEASGEKWVSGCGSVHAALSVPRWRKFFDCAHSLRQCGREKCTRVCTEKRLEESLLDPLTPDVTTRPDNERRLEDRQEERRIEETRQEDSGENAIVPAAARNEPASVHYDQGGGGYGNVYRADFNQPQQSKTGFNQDPRRKGQRAEDLRFDRPAELAAEHAASVYPAHNYNYPREDLVRGHELRNWTSAGQVLLRPVDYDEPVPSNLVGTSPPFSSPPSLYPPPFAGQPTNPVPQVFNPAFGPGAGGGPLPSVEFPAASPQPTARQREFEPYRSDFKGGEYGDNAADYGEEEPSGGARTRTPSYNASRATERHSPAMMTMSQPPVPPPFEPVDAAAGRPTNNLPAILLKSLFMIIYTLTL